MDVDETEISAEETEETEEETAEAEETEPETREAEGTEEEIREDTTAVAVIVAVTDPPADSVVVILAADGEIGATEVTRDM